MRILMLTHWFQPEPFFKGLPLAKAFCARGHEVEVLTAFPNYPGGKIYPGYRIRPWRRETMDGVRVNRVALYPSHDRSGLRRMVDYLSFAATSAMFGPWLVQRPDIIYVYNLITLGFTSGLIRRLRGGRIVLDVQDLWPESVSGSGMMRNRALLALLDRWSRAEYRRPDRLVVLSPGFKQHLAARGVAPAKIDVVYNWCEESQLQLPPRDEAVAQSLGFAGRFNVVFAGTMGVMQSLDVVLAAARRLQETASDVRLTFVGGGIELERLKAASADLSNVAFLPRRPLSEMGPILAHADALLVHLKNDPLFEITIPSKIQAYMHAGKPILCGVRGDAARLVQEAGAGLAFTPEDPASLTDAIVRLRSLDPAARTEMGQRGRDYYHKHMAFAEGVRLLEQSFEKALGRAVAQ